MAEAEYCADSQDHEHKHDQKQEHNEQIPEVEDPDQDDNPQATNLSRKKKESNIRDHIMFHKALISEAEDNVKLDQYMDMVEQLEHGMSIAFPDPFDRAIAITFELAIKNEFDPWDIDLETFAAQYLKHVRKNNDLDLVTAGRIILMAWKILKLQSDKVLQDAQMVKEIKDSELWHEPDGDWFTNDEDFEFTTAVISSPEPPIHEMVWHKGTRRVSLMELIGALEEAKRESELHKILAERRAEERDKQKKNRKRNIGNKLHQENLQDDIEMIYKRISKFNGHPIPLSDIYTAETEDKITTLISSLFLAHNKKINIWQRKFPFGQIFVKNLHNLNIDGPLRLGQDVDPDIINDIDGHPDHDNGGNDNGNGGEEIKKDDNNDEGKVLLRDLELGNIKKIDELDKKKKKKLKEGIDEYMTSQKNIAS
jgi:segregation and condensation protein A